MKVNVSHTQLKYVDCICDNPQRDFEPIVTNRIYSVFWLHFTIGKMV